MCNGSGQVRTVYQDRIVYRNKVVKEKDDKHYDLDEIAYQVHSRLNKNEFKIFSKGIVKHLAYADFKRAAASFNYLTDLALGTRQEPEKRLSDELQKVKKEDLDHIIKTYQGENVIHVQSDEFVVKLRNLQQKFENIYRNFFGENNFGANDDRNIN